MSRILAVSVLLLTVGCAMAEPGEVVPPPLDSEPPVADQAVEERDDSGEDDSEEDDSEEEEGPVDDEPGLPRWVWEALLRVYRPDPYILDHVSREAVRNSNGGLKCPDLDIDRYRGDTIRYYRTVWVYPAFRQRLQRFERVAARVGEEVYGRAPDRLFQRGTFVCKVIRHRRHRFSEHALGNAIDLIGLGFPPLPRDRRSEAGALGRRFKITVEDNWDGEGHVEHAVFFRRLVQELRAGFVFRGMIVPPASGHHDHLHLDMGPSRYLRGDVTLPLQRD